MTKAHQPSSQPSILSTPRGTAPSFRLRQNLRQFSLTPLLFRDSPRPQLPSASFLRLQIVTPEIGRAHFTFTRPRAPATVRLHPPLLQNHYIQIGSSVSSLHSALGTWVCHYHPSAGPELQHESLVPHTPEDSTVCQSPNRCRLLGTVVFQLSPHIYPNY